MIFALLTTLLLSTTEVLDRLTLDTFDVIVIGEVHDNDAHHRFKADALAVLQPKAVVYEMLTADEAGALMALPRTGEAVKQVISGFHWGNIEDYVGVLSQSPIIIGAALPRQQVRAAFSSTAAEAFDGDVDLFGLTTPLSKTEQSVREEMQYRAHCKAMPRDMMPGMVEAQRLRDAELARATLEALDQFGAPVVVITGNGHARRDWGIPAVFERANPMLRILSIGAGEDGQPPAGTFDLVFDSPKPDRGDPCAVFRKN